MTARDAAVRAVAEAVPPCVVDAECAIAALATSADVRAGLNAAMRSAFDGSTTSGLVDAVLAALGGAG